MTQHVPGRKATVGELESAPSDGARPGRAAGTSPPCTALRHHRGPIHQPHLLQKWHFVSISRPQRVGGWVALALPCPRGRCARRPPTTATPALLPAASSFRSLKSVWHKVPGQKLSTLANALAFLAPLPSTGSQGQSAGASVSSPGPRPVSPPHLPLALTPSTSPCFPCRHHHTNSWFGQGARARQRKGAEGRRGGVGEQPSVCYSGHVPLSHTRTRMHTLTHLHTCIHVCPCSCTRTLSIHTHSHTCTHSTDSYTVSHSYICTHTVAHSFTMHTPTILHSYTHSYRHTCLCTLMHTHTHIQTHMHAHSHTLTPILADAMIFPGWADRSQP